MEVNREKQVRMLGYVGHEVGVVRRELYTRGDPMSRLSKEDSPGHPETYTSHLR